MAKKKKMNTSFIIHEDMQREEMKDLVVQMPKKL